MSVLLERRPVITDRKGVERVAISMKGDVKRSISPPTGSTVLFLDSPDYRVGERDRVSGSFPRSAIGLEIECDTVGAKRRV